MPRRHPRRSPSRWARLTVRWLRPSRRSSADGRRRHRRAGTTPVRTCTPCTDRRRHRARRRAASQQSRGRASQVEEEVFPVPSPRRGRRVAAACDERRLDLRVPPRSSKGRRPVRGPPRLPPAGHRSRQPSGRATLPGRRPMPRASPRGRQRRPGVRRDQQRRHAVGGHDADGDAAPRGSRRRPPRRPARRPWLSRRRAPAAPSRSAASRLPPAGPAPSCRSRPRSPHDRGSRGAARRDAPTREASSRDDLLQRDVGVPQQLLEGVQLVRLLVEDALDAGVDQHLEAMDARRVRDVDVGVADRRRRSSPPARSR